MDGVAAVSASYWQEPHTRETLARRRLVLAQHREALDCEERAIEDLETALDLIERENGK